MNTSIRIVSIACLALFTSCTIESTEVDSSSTVIPDNAIMMYFGHPEGTTDEYSTAKSALASGTESEDLLKARQARATLFLEMSTLLDEIGLSSEENGSLILAPWQASYDTLQDFLDNPPAEATNLPSYVIDQMLVQVMLKLTDFSISEERSLEKTQLAESFLDILTVNRFPHPEVAVAILPIVQETWDAQKTADIANSILNSHDDFKNKMSVLKESCGQNCFEFRVEGATRAERFSRQEAITLLEKLR